MDNGSAPDGANGHHLAVVAFGVALAIASLAMIGLIEPASRPLQVHAALIAAMFLAADRFVVNAPIGTETHSVTLMEVPLAMALVSVSPGTAMLSRVGATLIGQSLGRVSPHKIAFNCTAGAFEVAVAYLVFQSIAPTADPTSRLSWLALLASVLAADLVGCHTLGVVIWIHERSFSLSEHGAAVMYGSVAALINGSLGIVTVVTVSVDPVAVAPLVAAGALVLAVYRAWVLTRRRYSNLHRLYSVIDALGDSPPDLDAQLAITTDRVRQALSARRTAAVVIDSHGAVLARSESGGTEEDTPWWLDLPREPTHLDAAGASVFGLSRSDSIREALVCPIQIGDEVTGALLVCERLDDTTHFDDDDLRLLSAVAGHLAAQLHATQLIDTLRAEAERRARQALTDNLTGLPNRLGLEEAHRTHAPARGTSTVIQLDLLGLDLLHETLGRDAGDQLVSVLATRLQRLTDGHLLARLDNGSFVVVLSRDEAHPAGSGPAGSGPTDAGPVETEPVETEPVAVEPVAVEPVEFEPIAVTERLIRAAASHPVRLGALSVSPRLRAGVTSVEEPTALPILLAQAATALAAAHRNDQEVQRFDPSDAIDAARRLVVSNALGAAIDGREIGPHFQAKLDLRTHRVVGFEALARWHSATLGHVRPDEFIPLAELGGLVGDLTQVMVDMSLARCNHWRELGFDISVAVNLSAISLGDPATIGAIDVALALHGLPASALTIELTESAVMRDIERSIQVLTELRERGVRLSIDDFGTGHSSLAYLSRMPVHEVKLDKSFVQRALTVDADRSIVESTIQLAHRLGLTVVAEGIEDEPTLHLLVDVGCDLAQGYFISRPLPAADIPALLEARGRSMLERSR